MASIVLNSAATYVGNSNPLLNLGLRLASKTVGKQVDNWLLARFQPPKIVGSRLSDVAVQSSAYGDMMPVIYGNARIAGNIIWSRPIKETASTSSAGSSGGKGGAGTASRRQTTFSYSVTLAIGLCEGPIDEVVRIWADSTIIDPEQLAGSYRIYQGDEAQMPDPVMEGFEGSGNVPAYRGMAYIVLEDFPLEEFGNRVPNFTFELKRRVMEAGAEEEVEEAIHEMMVIPGAGEFVYDTQVQQKLAGKDVGGNWIQQGGLQAINQNNLHHKADAVLALDQLQETCPNLTWIGLVVSWFGDSLDAGQCIIKPGVEYTEGAHTQPDSWQVAGYTRGTAHPISTDEQGIVRYGGTPTDASVLRLIAEAKNRGLKVMLYPMVFMDLPDKPWRGRMSGTPVNVSNLFTKTEGYDAFIMHYANLVGSQVDAFVIGSELIGLTSVQDVDNSFPAVDALVNLAWLVKPVVGSNVTVTYAADWSEYHHTTGGWYHLDPLWASPNIDVVGIDAYFPLTDTPQESITEQDIKDGWTSGEGYDWIYTDEARTIKQNIAPEYAWKNIEWWWKNTHTNPDSSVTAWVPESKKIWFTEFGFPSVDGCSNQPNVFFDPASSEGALPRFSTGSIDIRAQRMAIRATRAVWKNSTMIERQFLWTWDARPFPFWPDLTSIWGDGPLWATGHWVQGKFGTSGLGSIIRNLCQRAGIKDAEIDTSRFSDLVDGYVLADQTTAKEAVGDLQQAYFFDIQDSSPLLSFMPRGNLPIITLTEEDLVPDRKNKLLRLIRVEENEIPQKVDVNYIRKSSDYQVGNQHARRISGYSQEQQTLNLPVVMNDQQARTIADIALFERWNSRTLYVFRLSMRHAALEPADVVQLEVEGKTHLLRLVRTEVKTPGVMEVEAVIENQLLYRRNYAPSSGEGTYSLPPEGEVALQMLDIPSLTQTDTPQLHVAACGTGGRWQGAALYRSDDTGTTFRQSVDIEQQAVLGSVVEALPLAFASLVDRGSSLEVLLLQGELESISEEAVLNGANAALVGDEIIQFQTATYLEAQRYRLSGFLRGRMGTEWAMAEHSAGERFVLLDSLVQAVEVSPSLFGIKRHYKAAAFGQSLESAALVPFTYEARTLMPYAPAHVRGVRQSDDSLTIQWIRRARVQGQWANGIDVPLDEASEQYEVDILDGGGAVVRTIAGLASPTCSYSAAEQTADFGSVQVNVRVVVYQVSQRVGRGYGTEETIR